MPSARAESTRNQTRAPRYGSPPLAKVATITVDKPIVTTWHTSAQDAVPGDGTDGALLFNRLVDKLESQR